MNILIIEDDLFLADNIKNIFEKKIITNRIKIISNYNDFCREISIIKTYDIILVDILLWPKESKNWIDLINEIRSKTKIIPIVIISWLDDISRIEKWFEKWANDYIVKPFRLKELEIRVFKWFQMYFYTDLSGKNKVSYKWLEYDVLKNEFYYNWKLIELTKWNKYLLSIFLSRPEILLKENYLTEKIWWDIADVIDRNLRVNILRLKTSLIPYKLDNWITNIRWEWYILKKN